MKPSKNKVYCYGCGRTKMLFESEKKALNFIKYNNLDILEESGKAPSRVYYCDLCCGYHLTSIAKSKYANPRGEDVLYSTELLITIEKCISLLENKAMKKEPVAELTKCIQRGFKEAKNCHGVYLSYYNRLKKRFDKMCGKYNLHRYL